MPELKPLYKSDFYEIYADAANSILRAFWIRTVSKEEMKTGGTMLRDAILESGYTKVLANAQNLQSLDFETKEWMSTKFYELLSETPLEKIARILPANLFFQLALESVATRAEALGIVNFKYKNFRNEEDAFAWLQEKKVLIFSLC